MLGLKSTTWNTKRCTAAAKQIETREKLGFFAKMHVRKHPALKALQAAVHLQQSAQGEICNEVMNVVGN